MARWRRAKTMPSTHASLHYHLIFSTKDRMPLINTELRPDLDTRGFTSGYLLEAASRQVTKNYFSPPPEKPQK
jgi:hypothetical protein